MMLAQSSVKRSALSDNVCLLPRSLTPLVVCLQRTKYEAEVEVQAARDAGLRVAIYRPAIVVGDAASGATQKFDGPYL